MEKYAGRLYWTCSRGWWQQPCHTSTTHASIMAVGVRRNGFGICRAPRPTAEPRRMPVRCDARAPHLPASIASNRKRERQGEDMRLRIPNTSQTFRRAALRPSAAACCTTKNLTTRLTTMARNATALILGIGLFPVTLQGQGGGLLQMVGNGLVHPVHQPGDQPTGKQQGQQQPQPNPTAFHGTSFPSQRT